MPRLIAEAALKRADGAVHLVLIGTSLAIAVRRQDADAAVLMAEVANAVGAEVRVCVCVCACVRACVRVCVRAAGPWARM